MADAPKIEQWPVVRRRVDSLVAYERNPRTVAPADYERLKRSIVENGYIAKVVATHDGKIIGGHVRIHVLKSLGVEEIDVVQAPGPITEEQYKRLLLIDNIHAGQFDPMLLKADFTVNELQSIGVPQQVIGLIHDKPPRDKKITDQTGFAVLIELPTEAEQEKFYSEMKQRGLTCKLLS